VHGAPQFQQTLLECLTEAALDGVIVIDAEGRIWAHSPGEGQGSTFSVWLPALSAPPLAAAGAPGAATPPPREGPSAGSPVP
jgi:hypothetical protein